MLHFIFAAAPFLDLGWAIFFTLPEHTFAIYFHRKTIWFDENSEFSDIYLEDKYELARRFTMTRSRIMDTVIAN